MTNQKGFTPLVVILIIVAVLAVGGYFALKSRIAVAPTLSPTPLTSAIPDETADWKTYTNTKYGFGFRYPKDWDIKIIDVNVKQSYQSEPLTYFSKYKLAEFYAVFTENKNGKTEFDLIVYKNPQSLSVSDFYRKYNDTGFEVASTKIVDANQFLIGNLGGMSNGVALVTEKNGKIFAMEDVYRYQNTNFYEQILSTFKFTTTPSSSPTPILNKNCGSFCAPSDCGTGYHWKPNGYSAGETTKGSCEPN